MVGASHVVWTVPGSLGASAYVVANDAKAETKAWATILQEAGYPVRVCDGTADNVEIQEMIDTLPAGGGEVRLSEGTFTIAATLTPLDKPINLVGSGRESTILSLANSANCSMVKVGAGTASSVNVGSIQHLTMRGNSSNNTSGSGLWVINGDHFLLFDVVIGGNTAGYGFAENGIFIDPVSGSIRIDYMKVQNCDIAMNLQHGIYCDANTNCLLINASLIHDNGTSGQDYHDIYLINGADVNISNCFLWQSYGAEIVLNQGGTIHITGNSFNTPKREAIRLKGGVAAVTIIGNTFQEASFESSGVYPYISLGTASSTANNCIIVGNWEQVGVTNPSSFIVEGSGSVGNVITGNRIIDRGVTIAGANSICVANSGWTTEKIGSATLLNGQTSVVFSHSLATTPSHVDISWKENPTNVIADWWWTADGATVTLNGVDPGASNLDFSWEAKV